MLYSINTQRDERTLAAAELPAAQALAAEVLPLVSIELRLYGRRGLNFEMHDRSGCAVDVEDRWAKSAAPACSKCLPHPFAMHCSAGYRAAMSRDGGS